MESQEIRLELDPASVQRAVDQANKQLDLYERKAITAGSNAGAAFEASGKRISRANDESRASFERQAVSLGNSRSAIDRHTESVRASVRAMDEWAGRHPVLIAASIKLGQEYIAHRGSINSMADAYRALRLAATPTLFTGIQLAAGAATIAILERSYAVGKIVDQQAIAAARSKLSIAEVQQLSLTSKAAGFDPDFFRKAVDQLDATPTADRALARLGISQADKDAKSWPELLGSIGRAMDGVRDPVEHARLSIELFGEEVGVKILPGLNRSIAENMATFDRFGAVLGKDRSQEIFDFKRNVDELRGSFDDLKVSIEAQEKGLSSWFATLGATVGNRAFLGGKLFGAFVNSPGLSGFDPRLLTGAPPVAPFPDKLGIDARGLALYETGRDADSIRRRFLASREGIEQQLSEQRRIRDEAASLINTGVVIEPARGNQPARPRFATQQERLNANLRFISASQSSNSLQGEIDRLDLIKRQTEKAQALAAENAEALRKLRVDEAERIQHPYGLLPADRQLLEIQKREAIRPQDVSEARSILGPLRSQEALDIQRRGIALAGSSAERTATATGFGVETTRSAEDLSAHLRDLGNKQVAEFHDVLQREDRLLSDSINIRTSMLEEQHRAEQRAAEGAVRIYSTLAPDTLNERIGAESAIADIRRRAADEEFRSAKIRLDAEKDVLDLIRTDDEETRQRRQNNALAQRDLELKNIHDIADIQQRYDESRAQETRRQLDSIKRESEGLLNTLFTHPSQFGSQLLSTVRTATLRPITEGLSETISRRLHPFIYGESGTTGIAGSLRSAFGGGGLNDVHLVNGAVPVVVVGGGSNTTVNLPRGGATVSQPFGSAAMMAMLTGLSQEGGFGGFSSAGGSGPLGQVSSSIDFGAGPIGLGGTNYGALDQVSSTVGGPGGTSGFAGPVGGFGGLFGGGSGVGGFNPRALLGMFQGGGALGNLIGYKGAGLWDVGKATGVPNATGIGFKGALGGIAGSPAAGIGGALLAQQSLMGSWAGSAKGILGGTAGGALVGFQLGGPLGAAIGAGVGFGIGLGEFAAGVEPQWKEAERLVNDAYHIKINRSTANQIVALAKQSYGNHVSIAVRSPEVRQMLGLYAAGTGQAGAFPQSATTPHGASLVESGGRLFQGSMYQYGNAYVQESSLPVYGGGSPGILPAAGGPAPQMVFNIQGAAVDRFLTGQVFTPEAVSDRYGAAMAASAGRRQNAMSMLNPGDIIS